MPIKIVFNNIVYNFATEKEALAFIKELLDGGLIDTMQHNEMVKDVKARLEKEKPTEKIALVEPLPEFNEEKPGDYLNEVRSWGKRQIANKSLTEEEVLAYAGQAYDNYQNFLGIQPISPLRRQVVEQGIKEQEAFRTDKQKEIESVAKQLQYTRQQQNQELGLGEPVRPLSEFLAKAERLVTEQTLRREDIQAEQAQRQKKIRAWRPSYGQPPVQPEYAPAFQETVTGMQGTQPAIDWFERQYPSIVSQFKTTLPEFRAGAWPKVIEKMRDWRELKKAGKPYEKKRRMTPREVENLIETKMWPEYLKTATLRKKEEYATRFPFGGTEWQPAKPWAYQPRVKTVAF